MRGLARRQHGVFALDQLRDARVSKRVVDHWLATERIVAVHRAVYSFSELLSREGRWMAAVLAAGPGAVLSHASAAALWGIRPDTGPPSHVTLPRKLLRRAGLATHYLPLAADESTSRNGIPVTTPGRTLFDIAHELRRSQLERAVREADYLRLSDGPSLRELVGRYPGRTGIRAVKRLLESGWSDAPTRSELEARFAAFIDEYDLPRPERNALIELPAKRIEVDFVWRAARLVVELDGYAAHRTRDAFEEDRERDRLLQLAGFRVLRVTWRQLHRDRRALVRDLRAASLHRP
jgi:hypothetical protein